MFKLRVWFYCLFIAFAAVGLGGCQSSPVGTPVTPAGQATITTEDRSLVVTARSAPKGADLFVATGSDVYVLSYPRGRTLGNLGISGYNLCADRMGNVFVPTSAYEIAEFSHGGKLVRTLHDGDTPLGCAVDRTTGNLAVTNAASGAGEVAIYPDEQEPAQWYRDPAIDTFGLCGYDDHGNLFVDGTGSAAVLAELPKGSATFTNYALTRKFDAYGSVQWDGQYITLSAPTRHVVYRLKLTDGKVEVVGATHFSRWFNSYSGHWPYVETLVEHNTFVAQSSMKAKIGLWGYPQGGEPKQVVGPFEKGSANVYGFAISIASR